MNREPMDLAEAEMLARAGSSGRVADALLRELDASRKRLDDARVQMDELHKVARALLAQMDRGVYGGPERDALRVLGG